MKSVLRPAIENIDRALADLELAVETTVLKSQKKRAEPQLDLNARNEREVNKKIAARLDQTINRLETLLCED